MYFCSSNLDKNNHLRIPNSRSPDLWPGFIVGAQLLYRVWDINRLVLSFPLLVFNWFEFSFPFHRPIAIPRLESPICPHCWRENIFPKDIRFSQEYEPLLCKKVTEAFFIAINRVYIRVINSRESFPLYFGLLTTYHLNYYLTSMIKITIDVKCVH